MSLAAPARQAADKRHEAVLALRPSDPEAVRHLIDFLGDSSWRVRKAALSVVHRFRDQPSLVVELIAGLTAESNVGLRNACSEALRGLGEAVVDALIAALRTRDSYQRKAVAEILGSAGTLRAKAGLLGALEDPDENVRTAVAEALGSIGGDEVVMRLRGRLRDAGRRDLLLTAYLLDALARAEASLPTEELEAFVCEKSLLRHVYPLLGLSGDARAAAHLLAGVRSGSKGTRYTAVSALAGLAHKLGGADRAALARTLREDEALLASLREVMSAEPDEVGSAAVELVGLAGDPRAAPMILAACAGRSFLAVGVEAVHRLGKPAVDALAAVIYEVEPETRILALEVFELLGDASMTASCVRVIQQCDPRSAEAAIRALGRFAGIEVAETLIRIIESGNEDLTDQAALSLAAIGRRSEQAIAERLRRAVDAGQLLPAWLQVLAAIGRPQDAVVVSAAIGHKDASVRAAALLAAAQYGGGVGRESVVFALADENAQVRVAAARALSAFPLEHGEAALLAALRDPDPWVAAEAARTLGLLGSKRALPELTAAAESTSSPIAIAALGALFRLNPPELEGAMRRAIKHGDAEVVHDALGCIMRLPDGPARELLIELLDHRAWDVRRAAAGALANRNFTVPADVLGRRLDVESEELVRVSLLALRAAPEDAP